MRPPGREVCSFGGGSGWSVGNQWVGWVQSAVVTPKSAIQVRTSWEEPDMSSRPARTTRSSHSGALFGGGRVAFDEGVGDAWGSAFEDGDVRVVGEAAGGWEEDAAVEFGGGLTEGGA
ncbi:hypothetical protein GCM10022221_66140 [Actinocorallia aurea]